MLRRLWRSALDHELGVLGEEVEKALAKLEDAQIKLEALAERIERRLNTVGMRTARASRGEQLSESDRLVAATSRGGSDGAQSWEADLLKSIRGH